MIIDAAVYEHSGRVRCEATAESVKATLESSENGFAWVGLLDPTAQEIRSFGKALGLDSDAIRDTATYSQRPKLESYGETMMLSLKTSHYVDPEEVINVGQLTILLNRRCVLTIRHDGPQLTGRRKQIEKDSQLMKHGTCGVLVGLFEGIVETYQEATAGLDVDVQEVEQALFSDTGGVIAERIYKLGRETIQFHHIVDQFADPLEALTSGSFELVTQDLHPRIMLIAERLQRVQSRTETIHSLLDNALQVNLTQLTIRQNNDMRKISAWVAIAAVPTAVAGIYGMNFEHMPELKSTFGYPAVLLLMICVCGFLYRQFRKSGWL